MSTLSNIKKIEVTRKAEQTEDEKRYKKQRARLDAQIESLFQLFRESIADLDRSEVSGRRVTISVGKSQAAPNTKIVQMSLNGVPEFEFHVKENIHYCNCENCREGMGCGEPPSYSHYIDIRTLGKKYLPFSSLWEYEIKDEDKFAYSMLRLIEASDRLI